MFDNYKEILEKNMRDYNNPETQIHVHVFTTRIEECDPHKFKG